MIEIKIENAAKLTEDIKGQLEKYVSDLQEQVLFAGVATMAKVIYDEVKHNASGFEGNADAGVGRNYIKRTGKFPAQVTGNLFNSIRRAFIPRNSSETSKTYHVFASGKAKGNHWNLLEFGTSKARPFPIFRPAYDAKINEAQRAALQAMKDKLRQIDTGKTKTGFFS